MTACAGAVRVSPTNWLTHQFGREPSVPRTGVCPVCQSVQPLGEVREKGAPRFWCLTCGSPVAAVDGGPAPEPPAILCIDDDRLVLRVCHDALEEQGYRVLTAPDGLAGIEVAVRERPALILLDVMMPGMDGFEVCAILRTNAALQTTPIILLTAMNLPDLEFKGAEVGATLTMKKPFGPELIVSTVERILGGADRRGE